MIESLLYLFLGSLLISLVTFGGGSQALFYQMAVQQKGWITNGDLSAVLAFGYATPGPAVFGTATFIGYHLAGIPGALVGTVGIFLAPFLLALLATRFLSHLLENPHAKFFVRGVGLAAAGLVAATAIQVMRPKTMSWLYICIAVVAFVATMRRAHPLFVLIVGGVFGLVIG